eukprot:TRINITY_DN30953_c0_g1_i2.p1 TRINITY_DN30953_c0_g1~~TRINITY_DN30953_c0_g1_i2.p1  ORF type:complete len:215 (-),score=34.52 TRINITY_DN30953_c0_g1_i2:63-707(-)
MLSLSHYGFQITRSGLFVMEGWICDAPIDTATITTTNHHRPAWHNNYQCGADDTTPTHLTNETIGTTTGVILPTSASSTIQCSSPTDMEGNVEGMCDTIPPKNTPLLSTETPPPTPASFCATSIIHEALFYIEYNPALLATTPFARPLVQFILVGLIVLVSRAKRLSKLEPTRMAVERMNVEVLQPVMAVSYTHLRAHETPEHLVCRLLLEKKK